MDLPDSFCMESDTGIFIMEKKGTRFGRTRYEGSANGISCAISISGRFDYRISIRTDRLPEGMGERADRGRAFSLEGAIKGASDWIDSIMWDYVEEPGAYDTRYIDTSNGRIAYYCYNTHFDSIPVLFLHGGPGGDGAGTTRMRKLHLHHPVYTYDQMGCGNSDAIPDLSKWNHEDYFRELNEIILALGFEKVILIGASWGAGLAVGYAARYGCDRIASMVLPSPFISSRRWEEDQMVNLSTMSEGCQRMMKDCIEGKGTRDDYHKVMVEYYSKYLFTRRCNREIAVEAGMAEQDDVFKAMWGANDFICTGTMKDLELIPELAKIDVPVLFMCGDSDEVTLDTMLEYQGMVKGSRLSIIPYAGHVLSMEQPESYYAAVRSFLDELYHQQ